MSGSTTRGVLERRLDSLLARIAVIDDELETRLAIQHLMGAAAVVGKPISLLELAEVIDPFLELNIGV